MQASPNEPSVWHGTTILTVRKGGKVVIGGDGQVSIGQTVIKSNSKKVRKLGKGAVIGGFAGATADAFTLFERLESKLEQYPGQLTRAAVELAKDWRTDRYLRRLEAMMIVADKERSGGAGILEPMTPTPTEQAAPRSRQLLGVLLATLIASIAVGGVLGGYAIGRTTRDRYVERVRTVITTENTVRSLYEALGQELDDPV